MHHMDSAPTTLEQAAALVSAVQGELASGKLTGDSTAAVLQSDLDLFTLLWEQRTLAGDMDGAFSALNDLMARTGSLLASTSLIAAGALSTVESVSGVPAGRVLTSIVDTLQGRA